MPWPAQPILSPAATAIAGVTGKVDTSPAGLVGVGIVSVPLSNITWYWFAVPVGCRTYAWKGSPAEGYGAEPWLVWFQTWKLSSAPAGSGALFWTPKTVGPSDAKARAISGLPKRAGVPAATVTMALGCTWGLLAQFENGPK